MAGLTIERKQLQEFIKDPRTLKAFEKLFEVANTLYPPETLAAVAQAVSDPRVDVGDAAARNVGTRVSEVASGDRGVTNGDTHDHSGGDGAQINHTTLASIGTNTHAQIDTHLGAAAPHSGHAIIGRNISTQFSLTGGGDLSADRTLNLLNDVAAPGVNQVYGTNAGGVRGWKPDPGGFSNLSTAMFTKALVDGVATAVFTITTTNEVLAHDAGTYVCLISGMITNGTGPDAVFVSTKALNARFSRSLMNSGATGVSGAVGSTVDASVPTSAADRDIGAVAVSVAETSEYVVHVDVTAVHSGTEAADLYATLYVTLIWQGFTTAPTMAAA